jgi:uncharacterized cupin superfamily protein
VCPARSRSSKFPGLTTRGAPTLFTDAGATELSPGMYAGGSAHHLENRSNGDVLILEIGDRGAGDSALYPDDNLAVTMVPDGNWTYTPKDGSPP